MENSSVSTWADFITVRLFDADGYSDPCARLPLEGITAFWEALGVTKAAEEEFQPEWVKGNWIPVAAEFPVLSGLIQMQIDNASIRQTDIPALLREVLAGRARCKQGSGIQVFDELEKAGKLASKQSKGLSLSPFG